MTPITFRNSRIVYYGPHSCENCGVNIVKMGREWGGTSFTNPEGPIYPNTEWHPHVCDQQLVRQRLGLSAASRVTEDFPNANAVLLNNWGWVVLGEACSPTSTHALVISMNMTSYDTEDAAWMGALERIEKGNPTWHKDLSKFGVHSKTSNLERAERVKPGDDFYRLHKCDSDEEPRCGLCGLPMPKGEEMFNYRGYSGPCPTPKPAQ